MRTVATFTTDHTNGTETITAIYDVLTFANSNKAAFAVRRPLLTGKSPIFFLAGTSPAQAVGDKVFEHKGQSFYMSTFYNGNDANEFNDITDSDRAAFGVTEADIAVAIAAAHA